MASFGGLGAPSLQKCPPGGLSREHWEALFSTQNERRFDDLMMICHVFLTLKTDFVFFFVDGPPCSRFLLLGWPGTSKKLQQW